jgi:brefeldin A-resistance guanine nucleotide exchange factor 1
VTSNIVVLSQTLRGMTNLIACAAPYLHEQIEQFILTTHLRIADSKQSSFEHQELVLESLIELCRDTTLIVFLYEHYDCSEYSSNLFESICKFFSKNLKESETLHTIHVLSLQGLLSIVKCLAERCQDESANTVPNQESNTKLEEIRTRKETKKKMMEVAESFNGNFKHGIQKMRSAGLMGTSRIADEEGKLVANFLHEYSNWLSKSEIGKTIRNNGEFHERTLFHYMYGIDMHGLTVDEALRYMIQKFELTGEAQQVERQILQFADVYYASNPDHAHLKSSESVFMCAVSIIMLNTDLHNPQMKERNKMSLTQFINNSSYIGLPNDELERLYNNILKNQFQPSTSFNDTHKSDPMWEDMIQRSNKYLQQYPSVVSGASQLRLDVDMFQGMWGNTIMATSIVLENTEDVDVLEMSVRGFLDSARIAAHYRLSNVFDNLVITLCKFTQMLSSHQDNAITLFGQNEKAQLACRTVFAITRNYGDNLREGWKNILDLILRMYQLDLLPEELSERETFNQTKIKREGKKSSSQASQAGSGLYLFGFFGASDDNIQQKQSMDRAKKCIEQCRITDLLLEAKILHISSLEYLINALITACMESNTDQHSDTSMFCLDLLTDITIANKDAAHDRINIIWNYVYNHMNKLLMNVLSKYETNNTNKRLSKEHYAVIDRVLLCVLRQCIELMSGRDDMLTTMSKALHHVLTVIPPHLSHYFLLQLYPGIELLIKQAGSKLSARTWDLIFLLLRAGGSSAKTAEKAGQVCAVITREHGFYMPDNVPECVHTILALMGNRVESIELVSMLHQQVNHLIVTTQLQQSHSVSADSPWMRAWLTTLSGLTWLCTSSERDVRNQSIGVLQRILINSSDKTTETSSLPSSFLVLCLKQVLFVLLDDALALQGPRKRVSGHKLQEDYDREQQQQQQQQSVTSTNHFFGSLRHIQQQFDYSSLDELRLRVSALFTKIFLHFLPRVQETDELPALWETIMNYMYRFMNIGSDSLSESVPELLKNMILVMNNLEVFKNDQALWNRTEQQLNLFVPRLVEDVKTKVILPQQPQQQQLQQQQPQQQQQQSPQEEKVDVPQSL